MDSEPTEALRKQINQQLKSFESLSRYSYVKVLVIYWEHGDHPGFQTEGNDLGQMFQSIFNYDVETFVIPSMSSQLRLDNFISQVLLKAEDEARKTGGLSLLIVYYGGHGDRNDDHHKGEEKRSVWAAQSQGGPTLEWFEIQSKFDHTSVDTLLLLDCCFGAQAGRASIALPHRVELLAAAAMGVQTPMPGPRSFTAALIKAIQACLSEKGCVITSELHSKLVARGANLIATPVYIRLKHGGADRSIHLEPLREEQIISVGEAGGPSLRLLISTLGPIDNRRMKEIAEWLGSDVPRSIATLQVEEVLQTTAQICSSIKSEQESNQLNLFDESTQDGIIAEWNDLKSYIARFRSSQKKTFTSDEMVERSAMVQEILKQATLLPQKLLERVYQNILDSATTDEKTLNTLLDHPAIISAGLEEQLRLYQIAHNPKRCGEALYYDMPSSLDKPGQVLHEYKVYRPNLDLAEVEEAMHRVGLLADLLNISKSDGFRSLKCLNWLHEPAEHRFVLRFEKPSKYCTGSWQRTSLQSIIRSTKGPQRPSLGQRFNIALQIAGALQKWHSVEWLHQGISSHNVVFFQLNPGGSIDYSEPFLQGFEFSRPNQAPSIGRYVDDIASNVYRHPLRQGPSREGHRKVHDMYSLGVVLLEIGLWQSAREIISRGPGQELTVSLMKQRLESAASERLSHYAGTSYQDAVLTCLQERFDVEVDDRRESHLARSFQTKVVDRLNQLAKLF